VFSFSILFLALSHEVGREERLQMDRICLEWDVKLLTQSVSELFTYLSVICLQCFDAVGWSAGRASGLYKSEWWGAGVVICLERGVKSRLVLPF